MLTSIQSSLSEWQRHSLTPIGKIAVLKCHIMSKLNYLFLCIPDPGDRLIKKMEQLFFEFIWDKKPDKIKRNTLCLDYSSGGLKMFDIKTQISALKLTWLRRLIQNPNSDYHRLCTYNIKSLEKLLHMGPLYCTNIIDKTSNKFWVDILYNWKRLLHNLMGSAQSCYTCPLWYSPNISKEALFLPQCYRAGIIYPVDLCDRKGNMLTLEKL